MPELPEVEVVRAGLEPVVVGAVVTAVHIHDDRALTRHRGTATDFASALTGRTLTAVARRGKFLWMPLMPVRAGAPTRSVVGHLGMSGQILLCDAGARRARHERVRIDIQHPELGPRAIVFADQRTFGSLAVDDLIATDDGSSGGRGDSAATVPTQVAHIARDPLDPAFDDRGFAAVVQRRNSAIKRVLLDQTAVSGIGNIYADEALWAARIHPDSHGSVLPTRAVNRLLAALRVVFEAALAEGGTSFDTQYVNVNGRAGSFIRSLSAYGRAGQACPRCGTPIVRVAFTNRSSHFCPRCQRLRDA